MMKDEEVMDNFLYSAFKKERKGFFFIFESSLGRLVLLDVLNNATILMAITMASKRVIEFF